MSRRRGASRRTARTTRAVAGLGLLVGVSACAVGPPTSCTLIGGSSQVSVAVPPSIRSDLASLSVELCQADHCGRLTFRSTPPDRRYSFIQKGVNLDEQKAYVVDLAALGRGWRAGTPARLSVLGRAADSTTLVRRTDRFTFEKSYPNGKECDVTPYLSHQTRVVAGDRVD